ncbi:hypothetical protein F4802DRAFT_613900 [Xylaria palmicola]|nr:hypothetical protein F4802DRAFT_613900 [Xylaria palmicola]
MKSVLALLACPIAALADSRPIAGSFSAEAWKVRQDSDGTFFLGGPIHASGLKFYMNRNTSTYCPDGVSGLDCSQYAGTGTTLAIGEGSTTMGLEVTVPGGQQGKHPRFRTTPPPPFRHPWRQHVYVAPDGALSYTQAHSASMPAGSETTGFSRERSESFGAPVYLYSAGRGWYLCPVTEGEPRERTYQVFASSEPLSDCLITQIRSVGATLGTGAAKLFSRTPARAWPGKTRGQGGRGGGRGGDGDKARRPGTAIRRDGRVVTLDALYASGFLKPPVAQPGLAALAPHRDAAVVVRYVHRRGRGTERHEYIPDNDDDDDGPEEMPRAAVACPEGPAVPPPCVLPCRRRDTPSRPGGHWRWARVALSWRLPLPDSSRSVDEAVRAWIDTLPTEIVVIPIEKAAEMADEAGRPREPRRPGERIAWREF